jgi:hypothetical protein
MAKESALKNSRCGSRDASGRGLQGDAKALIMLSLVNQGKLIDTRLKYALARNGYFPV